MKWSQRFVTLLQREPVLLGGVIQTGVVLAGWLGLHLTVTQLAAIVTLLAPGLAVAVRSVVTPVSTPPSNSTDVPTTGRRLITPALLGQVSEIVKANPDTPTKAVSRELNTSHRNATRWIAAAKRSGA